jgi:hypothetical protein
VRGPAARRRLDGGQGYLERGPTIVQGALDRAIMFDGIDEVPPLETIRGFEVAAAPEVGEPLEKGRATRAPAGVASAGWPP